MVRAPDPARPARLDRVAGRRARPAPQPGHRGRDDERPRPRGAQGPGSPARKAEESLLAEVRHATDELNASIERRSASEKALAEEQQRLQRLARAAADRREGLAKLTGQVGARTSRIEAGEAEIGRLRGIVGQSLARAEAAEKEFASLESSVAVDEEGEEGLDFSPREGRRRARGGAGRGRATEGRGAGRRARPHQRGTARPRPSSSA